MNTSDGRRARLASLLPASLLLHLAIIFALTFAGRQPHPTGQKVPDMSVEYVENRILSADHFEPAVRRHDTMPEQKRSLTRMNVIKATPETPSVQIPTAGVTSQQGVSHFEPVVPALAQTTRAEPGIGLNSSSVPRVTTVGATREIQGAVAAITRQPRGSTPATVPTVSSHLRRAYQAQLKQLIEANKEYPLAARRSVREGSCQRRFVLARNGSLKQVEALSSCGHAFLDNAATRAITTVVSFPPLPDVFNGAEATFTITMTFTLAR